MVGNLRIIEELKNEIRQSSNVLFYPSSCRYHESFQNIPVDAVLLCSNAHPETKRIGKVYCFNFDNNVLLRLLAENNIEIDHLVLIRDGCSEGGNYECTNTPTFFGRLIPVLRNEFSVVADHGTRSSFFDIPVKSEQADIPEFLKIIIRRSDPIYECNFWNVQKFSIRKNIQFDRTIFYLVWDSILNHLQDLDLVIIYSSRPRGFINYFGLTQVDRNYIKINCNQFTPVNIIGRNICLMLTTDRIKSIKGLLNYSLIKKLNRIGFTPFSGGRQKNTFYKRILSELSDWSKDCPSEITFFHLNSRDYNQIYDYLEHECRDGLTD